MERQSPSRTGYSVGAHKGVLERQQALLPIVRGASIGTLHGLCLALGRTLLELVDDEGEEERYGKDRDKEVHEQADVRGQSSPQALYPGEPTLQHSWRALTGVETAQILASRGAIEDACAQFLLVLGGRVSRTPECPQPCPRAGTGGIQEELAERAGYHGAGKRCPAGDVSVL